MLDVNVPVTDVKIALHVRKPLVQECIAISVDNYV